MSVYSFTRKELKLQKATDFKDGDFIRVGKYGIHICYQDKEYKYETPNFLSLIENMNTEKLIDRTPGVDCPYYLDDFLGRK